MMFSIKNMPRSIQNPMIKISGADLVYSGKYKVTDEIPEVEVNVGKLVLSPTRTYAPIIIEVLKHFRSQIHGMVHCSGGAQTKVLHFVENVHIVKDNLFDTPPLFRLDSGTKRNRLERNV